MVKIVLSACVFVNNSATSCHSVASATSFIHLLDWLWPYTVLDSVRFRFFLCMLCKMYSVYLFFCCLLVLVVCRCVDVLNVLCIMFVRLVWVSIWIISVLFPFLSSFSSSYAKHNKHNDKAFCVICYVISLFSSFYVALKILLIVKTRRKHFIRVHATIPVQIRYSKWNFAQRIKTK